MFWGGTELGASGRAVSPLNQSSLQSPKIILCCIKFKYQLIDPLPARGIPGCWNT